MRKHTYPKSRLMALMLLLAFSVLPVRPQSADETVRPSANAQQSYSGASTEVGLHTGQLSVRIPLFTLPGKGIDIPVTLSFSNAGITHQSESSPFGLGWSVLAGGVITTTVNGNDDWKTESKSDIPWQYEHNYLWNKWQEQEADLSTGSNLVAGTLNAMQTDPMPDDYKYSFCGHSGSICLTFDENDQLQGKLYPDTNYRMTRMEDGYLITGDDGIKYYFEHKEYNYLRSDGSVSAWHLSKIKTPEGGTITFTYSEKIAKDYRMERTDASSRYPTQKLQILTRIDSDYGYVVFNAPRRKISYEPNSSRLTGIELCTPDSILIKGFELNLGTSFTNDSSDEAYESSSNFRTSLRSVIEYDSAGNYLPGYYFEYDYYFARSLASNKRCSIPGANCARGTWTPVPGYTAIVDRNIYGAPACWSEYVGSPQERLYGFTAQSDYYDTTIKDYFCLTRISFLNGGSEVFEYEPHDYSCIGNVAEIISPPSDIAGRRIAKRTIYDQGGTGQCIEYKYVIHHADYSSSSSSLSSGVLVTPSIHTSVAYQPTNLYGEWRLGAIPVTTEKPQNYLEGPIVCYTEVEERFSSVNGIFLGRKISYFEKQVAIPAKNYVYLNYELGDTGSHDNLLIPITNHIYGQTTGYPSSVKEFDNYNYTYMNYPVGKFYYPSRIGGKPLREITLDVSGHVLRKVDNIYNHSESPLLYGYVIRSYDDTKGIHPSFRALRYLVSQTTHSATYSRLSKQTVTEYKWDNGNTPTDSLVEVQTWSYTGNRLLSETHRIGTGKTMKTEYVYPDQVANHAVKTLTLQSLALLKMREVNLINRPVQIAHYEDNQCVEAQLYTYRQLLDNQIVVDSVFSLKTVPAGKLTTPSINTYGKFVRHANFEWERCYPSYGTGLKPQGIRYRNKPSVAFYWKGGHYLMLKAEGCDYQDLYRPDNTELQTQLSAFLSCKGASNELYDFNQYIRSALPAGTQVTTYTYRPLVGLTSETDPSGKSLYYDYDRYNRLSVTRDSGNLILEEKTYHYPGQRD